MLYGPTFQTGSPSRLMCHVVVLQPRGCRNTPGLGSSAFARRYLRNHCCFLFLRVLRCFSSPGWPLLRCHLFQMTGCPIRKSADLGIFAPPRGLSQLVTSFFASESLGIPRTLLLDFLVSSKNCKRICFLYLNLRLILVRLLRLPFQEALAIALCSLICLCFPICQSSLMNPGQIA